MRAKECFEVAQERSQGRSKVVEGLCYIIQLFHVFRIHDVEVALSGQMLSKLLAT